MRGTLQDVAAAFAERPVKGEIVVVIDRAAPRSASADDAEAMLKEALECQSIRDAAASVAEALGLPKRQVYQMALKLSAG